MKKMLLAMIGFFGLAFIVINYTFPDVTINKYNNIEAVKENTAIQQGWIPAIIPGSAYDISESHDLHKNTLFGSFSYKEKDEAGFMVHLTAREDMNTTLQWGNFLFKVDKESNHVQYRNKAISQ